MCVEICTTSCSLNRHSFSCHTYMTSFGDYLQINGSAQQRYTKKLLVFSLNAQPDSHWMLEFVKGPIPDTHHIDKSIAAAYFVKPTCPGNFHHFWSDEFIGLWDVVHNTGGLRLNTSEGFWNQVFYQRPYHLMSPASMGCESIKRLDSRMHGWRDRDNYRRKTVFSYCEDVLYVLIEPNIRLDVVFIKQSNKIKFI